MKMLTDSFGRVHKDLRISLTDKCNLRCRYCMPSDFSQWIASDNQLTTDELLLIVSVAVSHGIESIRLTGGEPLLRPDIIEIVSKISNLPDAPVISLTTNGINLAKFAQPLADAGLDRINISLDTLIPETFKTITFRNKHQDVLDGIEATLATHMRPVKINTVLLRGINDQETNSLVHWAVAKGLNLRFIEQMPLDAGGVWKREEMITADEILAELKREFELIPVDTRGAAPAEEFNILGTEFTVGVIASITKPFCAACDRIRLTSDGQLRSCLFSKKEDDLRSIVRNQALDENQKRELLSQRLNKTVASKLIGHEVNSDNYLAPERPMSAIGG